MYCNEENTGFENEGLVMFQNKIIETGRYWDKAFQLVDGCTKVNELCRNCWSEAMAKRFYKNGLVEHYTKNGFDLFNWQGKIICRHDNLDLPLRTRKPTVFSVWNDLFHEKVPFEFIDKVMAVIALCPQHTFLICTKRRMKEYFADETLYKIAGERVFEQFRIIRPAGQKYPCWAETNWPLPNLWLGCTPTKPEDIETLLSVPAAHHFISYEPLLEKPDIHTWLGLVWDGDNLAVRADLCGKKKLIDWVIVGAETGSNARYCPIENIENVVEQCKVAGVPVWVKVVHIGLPEKFKIVHKFDDLPGKVRVRELPWS